MHKFNGRVGSGVLIGGVASMLAGAVMPARAQRQTPYLHAPSIDTYAKHDPIGTTILPTGRLLKPVGAHLPLARWPHSLVLSPDGSMAFVASQGVGQLVRDWQGEHPGVTPIAFEEAVASAANTSRRRRANAGAAAFAPDGKTLYWSSGETGEIYIVDVAARLVRETIPLNGTLNQRAFADSFAMDIKASADGRFLYCADVTNFRVAVVDVAQKRVVGSVDVGRYPYALALRGTRVYVANIGMFAYAPIPAPSIAAQQNTGKAAKQQIGSGPQTGSGQSAGDTKDAGVKYDKRGLTFPAYGFPSREARDGVYAEGRDIPGLGDPNAPQSFSVWGVDVADPARPAVVSRIKTGLLVGGASDSGKSVGGSAPNFLLMDNRDTDALWVSNGNNDTIERISLSRNKVTLRVPLRPSPLVARLRGVGPSGMAQSPDGSRLYVAESGLNALAVIDAQQGRVLGHIPTAWYPYRVAIASDGKRLTCICFRGFGNGPNAGKNIPDSPFLHLKGTLSTLDTPSNTQLAAMTQNTLTYNGIVDKSEDRPRLSSPIIPATTIATGAVHDYEST